MLIDRRVYRPGIWKSVLSLVFLAGTFLGCGNQSEIALLPGGDFVHSYAADPIFYIYYKNGDLLAKTQFSDNERLRYIGTDDLYLSTYVDGVHELKRYHMQME